jgi:Zn-dependent peptidase ImmA (M78 family)
MNTWQAIKHFRNTIPVDVEGLALALGISVNTPFLPDNVSGMIRKRGEDDYEISVNATHPETRQRFTIAHEIGHFVLHRSLMGDGNVDDRAYRSDGSVPNNRIGPLQEEEANRFAANLLMPIEGITKFRSRAGGDVGKLARMFNVSEGAMKIRLRDKSDFEDFKSD